MIEDVIINECVQNYKLEVNSRNQKTYCAFMERQLAKELKDTKQYRELLMDKLLIFSYLLGERPVYESRTKPPVRIKKREQLKLMRFKGHDTMAWSDTRLGQINCRRNYGKRWYGFLSYVDIISELGKEPEIVKRWRGPISYAGDVGVRGRKIDTKTA